MKVIAAAIARMGAGRLPAKAMYPLAGKPAIAHVVDRMRLIGCADEVAVFTTDGPGDDPLAEYVEKELRVPVFRGAISPLERVAAGLDWMGADVYLHGAAVDNPLFWWEWAGDYLDALLAFDAEYVCLSNPENRRTVFGATHGVNPYTRGCIRKILEGARAAGGIYSNHVNLWMLHNHKRFKIAFASLKDGRIWRWTPHRLKMDTASDMVMLSRVFDMLYKGKPLSTWEVLEFLDANPEVARLNMTPQSIVDPWQGEQNWETGWVFRNWRGRMLASSQPPGADAVYCASGSCYLGYAMPGTGGWAEKLCFPNGTIIEGDADVACECGAGLHWRKP